MIISSWLVVAFRFLSLCIVLEVMIHYVRKIEALQEEEHSDITGAIINNSDCYLMTFDLQLLFICQYACVFSSVHQDFIIVFPLFLVNY